MTADDRAVLLAVPDAVIPASAMDAAARASGLDPYRLALMLRARGLVALAAGEAGRLEAARRELSEAGLRCAVVPASAARSLGAPQIAGGIASEESGVTLRVHGRPFGPPPGAPLLLLFADLARVGRTRSGEHLADSLGQRIGRAAYPVVELVWGEGRVRLAPQALSWRGFPGASFSSNENLLRLLELLAARSGGVTCDFHFDGEEMPIEPARVAAEPLEGADQERLALFEKYSAAAALAWNSGLYPAAPAGKMMELAPSRAAAGVAGTVASAQPLGATPIPWIRKDKASRLRLGLVPWIFGGPLVALRLLPSARLAAAVLAVCGAASVAVAAAGLRLRERLRAVPLARVRSLAMGPVSLAGRVAACVTLTAPYTRMPCAWYRFELQSRVGEGDSDWGGYRTVASGSSGDLPFRLDDGTGRVLVQPAGARIELEPETLSTGPSERVREWLLQEGESIFIAGFAQRRSPLEDEQRILRERLAAFKHDPAAMARWGVAGDGAAEAWDRARADVERRVVAELSDRSAEEDDVFVGSAPGQPFLIASRSRQQQTRRLTWQFAAGAALGITYLTAALLLLLLA